MSAEVIDARSLVPFNYEHVIASVKKTGKIIVAGDATNRGSFLNDLASNIGQLAFDWLDAPVCVLGSRNWITPAHELESAFSPPADGLSILFMSGYSLSQVMLQGKTSPTGRLSEGRKKRCLS